MAEVNASTAAEPPASPRVARVRTDACAGRILRGDLLVVESRAPQPGEFALVEMKGKQPVYLRQWVGETADKIRLCKPTAPDAVMELNRRRVANIYRVMSLADFLGA